MLKEPKPELSQRTSTLVEKLEEDRSNLVAHLGLTLGARPKSLNGSRRDLLRRVAHVELKRQTKSTV